MHIDVIGMGFIDNDHESLRRRYVVKKRPQSIVRCCLYCLVDDSGMRDRDVSRPCLHTNINAARHSRQSSYIIRQSNDIGVGNL